MTSTISTETSLFQEDEFIPAQLEFRPLVGKQLLSVDHATARWNMWEGAVRSSKTISSIVAWLDYVLTGPGGALMMIGKTERALKRNIIDPIQQMVGASRCRFRAGAGELDLLGRLIYTCGANDERAADKIKGLTLAGAYCDEVTTYPESFFNMLGTRMSVPGAQGFGTTNPASPHHWLKPMLDNASLHITRDGAILRSEDPSRLNLHRFSFVLDDNPNLAADYVTALKQEYTGLFYRRYILGEWVMAEGAVYDMWDDRFIVTYDSIPRIRRWISVGVDYGTHNPFDALLVGIGYDNRIYLVSEWRHDSRKARRSLTDMELSRGMRDWLGTTRYPGTRLLGVSPELVAVDPSAASFKVQLYADGLPAVNAKNTVMDGIRTMASLMSADKFRVVGETCPWFVQEVPGYSWDDKAAQKGEDAVLKVDDHSMDAARYGVHTTRNRWRRDVLPTGPADLFLEAA